MSSLSFQDGGNFYEGNDTSVFFGSPLTVTSKVIGIKSLTREIFFFLFLLGISVCNVERMKRLKGKKAYRKKVTFLRSQDERFIRTFVLLDGAEFP